MTSRQARKLRREEERKAKKAAYKASLRAVAAPAQPFTELALEQEFTPEFLADARAARERIHDGAMRGRIERRVATMKQSAAPRPNIPESTGLVSQYDSPPAESTTELGFVSQAVPTSGRTRAEINRANAVHSTGPRSSTGKLASSRNSLKHGLASGTLIVPGENPIAFDALLQSLLAEYQPANITEEILIKEMAQSWWLIQRALRLQNEGFTETGINEKRLALFLRYQTSHERSFHKALHALIRLQKDRRRGAERKQRPSLHKEPGFVSQQHLSIPDQPHVLSQNHTSSAPESRFVSQNLSPLRPAEAA